MKKRTLGNNKLEVSALGYGCMGLDFGYASALTKDDGVPLIRAAFHSGLGISQLDTLCAYPVI